MAPYSFTTVIAVSCKETVEKDSGLALAKTCSAKAVRNLSDHPFFEKNGNESSSKNLYNDYSYPAVAHPLERLKQTLCKYKLITQFLFLRMGIE